jgi:sporulation protein YlmC with PRC-barrel domain
MNTKNLLITIGVACAVVIGSFSARAQDGAKSEKVTDAAPSQPLVSDVKTRDAVSKDFPDGYLAQRLGAMQKGSSMPGSRVLDRADMPMGKVKDLLVEFSSGKIYCALVSVGDPEFTIAVPGRTFFPADNSKVVLDMTKGVLKGAPHFSTLDWDFVALKKSLGESYAYFNQKPLWDEGKGPGKLNKASEFMGMEVFDRENQSLGKVEDLMVDVPTARIVFVIVSFDGTEKSHYAVPPEALMLTSDNKVLFLDETKAKIRERAHESDYFWTELTDKNWAATTYRNYGIEPDFDTTVVVTDATREQVRAKVDELPPSKAAGKNDADINRMVLTALIQEDMENVFKRKSVKISTLNGHVTLTGKVKSQKQKDALGAAAESVVGPGYVDNQLESR